MKIYEKLIKMIRQEQQRVNEQYEKSVKTQFSDEKWSMLYASLDVMAEQIEKNSKNRYMQQDASSISNNIYQAAKQVQAGLNDYFSNVVIGTPETAKENGEFTFAVGSVIAAYDDAKYFIKDAEKVNA